MTAALLLLALGAAGWAGVRYTTWFGPWLADSLRSVFGVEAVAKLEEWSAETGDRWRGLGPEPEPRSLEQARSPDVPTTPAAMPERSATAELAPSSPAFRPRDVGPMSLDVAAPGDGLWVAVAGDGGGEAVLSTTLLHPDPRRPWSEAFVVAIDAARVRLELVAGTYHPATEVASARSYKRQGLIPAADHQHLLAAFNGGFKAEHGHYGMYVDGVTLIQPRSGVCTIARARNGELYIGTWQELQQSTESYSWWRQTPPCLVENGALHAALGDENERRWGAMIGGDTLIRRSALGLDRERRVLFMSVTNFTTAPAIAKAMRHAGATAVAELDVNWSFPHFVVFRLDGSGKLVAHGLFKGFLFDEDRYLRKPSPRDFFYLARSTEGG